MGLSVRVESKPASIILPGDSAIGVSSDDVQELFRVWNAYLEAFYDEAILLLKPEVQPTRFLLRQWTDEHRRAISAQPNDRDEWQMGVRCALIGVTNYTIVQDGIEKPAPPIDRKSEGRLGEIVPLSWFRDVNMPDVHLSLLYQAAKHHSEASPPLSVPSEQGSGPPKSKSQESIGE